MTDVFTPAKRSWIMSRVRGRDTKAEIIVRSAIHRMGFRFRLHAGDLAGRPDIVLARHRKVVFVHGCFWHGHRSCPRSSPPSSRTRFWRAKLGANTTRDARDLRALRRAGWRVMVVWECETRARERLLAKLRRFLAPIGDRWTRGGSRCRRA